MSLTNRVQKIIDEYGDYSDTTIYLIKKWGAWRVMVRTGHCGGTDYDYFEGFSDDEAKKILDLKLLPVW